MEGFPPPARTRRPPAVAWVLVLAVLVGVAAALLSRPVGSVGPAPPSLGGLTESQVGQIAAIAILVVGGLWLFLTLRDSGNRAPYPPRLVATLLMVLLLGVLFVEFAGLVHVSPIPSSPNGTGKSPPPPGMGANGSTNGTPFPFGVPGITLPSWAGFAVVLIVAFLAGVVLVPYLVARADERRRTRSDSEAKPAQEAQRALEQALNRLRSADGTDARRTILALYARLLHLVEPRLGTLESRTPREIERDSVTTLGLRPRVAQELTAAFEEARYSSHPMTPEAVDRVRAALTEAISDLARGAGVGP